MTREDSVRLFREIGDQLMEDMPQIGTLGQMGYYAVAKRLRLPGYEEIGLYESNRYRPPRRTFLPAILESHRPFALRSLALVHQGVSHRRA